jgi:general nucleoside transport system ATP-binding protein
VNLETRDLTKQFGSFTAVAGVSLSFGPGLHAIVGENGAGKSTFLKLLFGLHEPTSGEIFIDGVKKEFRSSMDAIRSGLGMVQQHFTLVDTLSVIDNIMLGAEAANGAGILKRKEAIKHLEALLPNASLAVPWETLVGDLTIGQKQRVEILKLLFRESRVLFLDEPTAVLAPQEIEELFSVLKLLASQGRTVIVITHKMREVLDHCDSYAVLRQGKLVDRGSVKTSSAEKIVEAMIGRAIQQRSIARPQPLGTHVLRCENLTEKETSRGQLKNISLDIRAGEIVGIAGVEGSGQGHLVEAIMGLRDFSGELTVLGESVRPHSTKQVRDLGVGLVPEDRHHQALWMEESCRLNYVVGLEDQFFKHSLLDYERLGKLSSEWSKEYDVRSASLEVPVSALSGGNQQKLIFAREVSGRKPRFLICHQPSRGVDLAAIDLIYGKLEALRNQGLGILVVSSELDELMDICDRIFVFFDGSVTAEFGRSEFDRFRIGRAMTGEVQL